MNQVKPAPAGFSWALPTMGRAMGESLADRRGRSAVQNHPQNGSEKVPLIGEAIPPSMAIAVAGSTGTRLALKFPSRQSVSTLLIPTLPTMSSSTLDDWL